MSVVNQLFRHKGLEDVGLYCQTLESIPHLQNAVKILSRES